MQPESHSMPQGEKDATAFGDVFYWRRMLLIQRWRRIAWLVCLFLAFWALLFIMLDPGFQHPSTVKLVKSMCAFIVAVLVAVNFLTFRLRR